MSKGVASSSILTHSVLSGQSVSLSSYIINWIKHEQALVFRKWNGIIYICKHAAHHASMQLGGPYLRYCRNRKGSGITAERKLTFFL